MSFIIDTQSLEDLNLTGKYKRNSIYSLFNQVRTVGGERLLEHIFNHPLSDPDGINERSAVFRYFEQQQLVFPFDKEKIERAEKYLNEGNDASYLGSAIGLLKHKISHAVLHSSEYEQLTDGLKAIISLLTEVSAYFNQFNDLENHPHMAEIEQLKRIFRDPRLVELAEESADLSFVKLNRYHYLLSKTLKKELELLFKVLYDLDVYIGVSDVARSKGMGYAKALPAIEGSLKASELRHPGLDKAVANSISLDRQQNMLFLTGANMAGKSTWMKTIGLSMYLAHLGFPVAAESLEFSVMEGIFSSINVPDNLNMGYSHFYAEVLRVKDVALQVSAGKNLLVLFDELFKGTNVKDAYDATLAVSQAFANYTNCLFVISTHIIEVGEELRECCENIQFRYLPTVMEGSVPRYTYLLNEGITSDRQGMMIIENEKILDIIGC